MTALVLDASVAMAWLLDDESEPRAEAVLAQLDESGALVPQHWHIEVRNALLTAERRGRLTANEVNERLRVLSALPIHIASEPNFDSALALARAHGLSFYDSLYLDLAKERSAALATLDDALAQAARAEALSLL